MKSPKQASSRSLITHAALVLVSACAGGPLSPDGGVSTPEQPDGSYSLVLPSGAATVRATRPGANGKDVPLTFLVRDTLVAKLDGTTLSPRAWGDTWLVAEAEGARDSVRVRVRSPAPAEVWHFTVEYGLKGNPAQPASASELDIARRQIDTVNARFNAAGTFDGIFKFELGRVYHINSIAEEMAVEPQADYRVLVDPNDMNYSTGFHGSSAIIFAWNAFAGGVPFSHPLHAANLAHELGHGRGAMDIYAGEVGVAARNTVNGATYLAPPSMMASSSPGWDAHSRNVINANAARRPPVEGHLYTDVPDDLVIRVTNGSGAPVDASVRVYPVYAYSFRIDPPAIREGQAGVDGEITFPNPYRSGALANLLVVATADGKSAHTWVPVEEVQLLRMRAPAARAFEVLVVVR